MAIDWRRQDRHDKLTFKMVSPTNINQVYGDLEGVDLSGSTLSAAYYSDTRTSGALRVVGGNWRRGSLLRVIHEVPEWGHRRELGTYIVTDDPATRENGVWVTELSLHSRLFGLSVDKHVKPWTIAKGARALKAMEQSLKAAGCPYRKVGSVKDCKYSSAKVIESGTPRLSALFTLSNAAKDRLDVDGHGYVTISPYVAPSSMAASYRIDLADARGVVQDGITRSTDWLQLPSIAGVSYKYSAKVKKSGKTTTVQKEIVGVARVSSGLHQSYTKRGYNVVDFRSLSSMNPVTQARANEIAASDLKSGARELIEWELTTTYLPIWEGDVVTLVVHDGPSEYRGTRKCLVKSLDLELEHMTMRLLLKETSAGAKGDT